MRCIVCACCVEVCPTKCLTMDTQYPVALTARGGVTKVTVAAPDGAKPEMKKHFFSKFRNISKLSIYLTDNLLTFV